tara:strand:+ start:434 stop:574 length:141 start_codon:yes stop_codon:yes gene_type:complete
VTAGARERERERGREREREGEKEEEEDALGILETVSIVLLVHDTLH